MPISPWTQLQPGRRTYRCESPNNSIHSFLGTRALSHTRELLQPHPLLINTSLSALGDTGESFSFFLWFRHLRESLHMACLGGERRSHKPEHMEASRSWETQGNRPPPRDSRRNHSYRCLDVNPLRLIFTLRICKTVKEYMRVVLRCSVLGNLLGQEAKTG